MNIKFISELKSPEESDFEIVERKGRGHPDTLADQLAELLSRTYSELTLRKTGVVLRHQFDKLSLMGGKCEVRFGGGNFRSPIRLLINGRITPRFGDENIEFRDLFISTATKFLEKELRNFSFATDCRVMWETTSNATRGMITNDIKGEGAINHRFSPRTLADLPEATKPISNDTAVGCSWAPFSSLEKLILEIENELTSDSTWEKYPWMGADVKIMGHRIGDEANMTVSIPQVSTFVNSSDEYLRNLEIIKAIIHKHAEEYPKFSKFYLTLNPGDNTDKEMLYLRYTGSCIESGDEGQVSRGNRLGGVISSRRPFSVEGLSGKNPSYHAGKVYSAAAWDIANKIYNELGIHSEIYIASQIDRPLNDPWTIVVNSISNVDQEAIEKIIDDIINNLNQVTLNMINGQYPLV